MTRTGWALATVGWAFLAVGLPGCEGLQDPPPKQGLDVIQPALPVEIEEIPKDLKPKQAPLPKLPKGAGELDADAPTELQPTESGLYYRILRKSDGRTPKPSETVVAHYQGTFDDGKEFDSSYAKGEPIPFRLDQVIRGWTEGLQLIGEGGMIELEIPFQLGYGPYGQPPKIPPKATLHFIVELKEIR